MSEILKKTLERKFKIKVPYSVIEKKMEENFLELSKNLKISGFRPGKIPISFVKNKYHKDVLSKVTEKIIQEEGNKNFEKEGFRLASQPKVTLLSKIEEKKDLEAEFIFEILPEIILQKFDKLKLIKFSSKVNIEDVNKVINNLFDDYKEFNEIKSDRKTKKGDRIVVSYKGFLNGEVFEGGSAENQSVDLGKNKYLPDFESNLIGKVKNENFDFEITFPHNYNNEKLKNKKVKFNAGIKNIFEGKRLSNEDELAKKTGAKNETDMREKITNELEKYSEDLSFSILKKSIVEALIKEYSFLLPNTLVEREIEQIKTTMPKEMEKQKKYNLKDIEEEAKNKVKLGLIISEIGIKNKINVSDKEIETALAKICMQYPGKEKEIINYYKSNPSYINSIKGPIFEDKVMKFIIENAKVTNKIITSEELVNKINELDTVKNKTKKKGKNEK